MQLIQKNRFYIQTILLIILATFIFTSCDKSEEFEEKGPTKQETRRVLVDVNIVSSDDKTTFEALFYYDIVGMVDGKNVSGVDKEVIKVDNAKLDDKELTETKDERGKIIYTTEIPNDAKEYELTFAPNENLQALHKIKVDPIYITDKNSPLEKSKTHEIKLSREVSRVELPAVVEMINPRGDFVPANVEYLSQGLFFREDALKPFANGKTNIKVRFESIPSARDENKSVRFFNYIIRREIEIIE